jgi:uncharacterized small protein (DUF1192 family)
MSCFDEEPEGGIHDECAYEITNLKRQLAEAQAEIERLKRTHKEVERLKAETLALCSAIEWYSRTLRDTQKLCADNQAAVSKFLEEAIAKVQK